VDGLFFTTPLQKNNTEHIGFPYTGSCNHFFREGAMKLFSFSNKSILLVIGIILLVGLLSFGFVPVTPVHAEASLAPTRLPAVNAAIDQEFSNIFHQEQNWLLIQQNNLSEANIILRLPCKNDWTK
jgi:hypothetical protein